MNQHTHQSPPIKRGPRYCGGIPILEVMTLKRTARFWSRVDRSGGSNACWPWIGRNRTVFGYGSFQGSDDCRRYSFVAHRVSLALHLGREPIGWVLHECDTPPCCNPLHLHEGTAADNTQDMRDRDRIRSGGAGVAPYGIEDRERVIELRRAGWKLAPIAIEVGCSWWTVQRWLKDAGETGVRRSDSRRGALPSAPLPREAQMPKSRRRKYGAAQLSSA
jgi:hypothetical protein